MKLIKFNQNISIIIYYNDFPVEVCPLDVYIAYELSAALTILTFYHFYHFSPS